MGATLRGTTNANVMKPIKIYEKLKLICKHLTHGRQEDAHEFLRFGLNSLYQYYQHPPAQVPCGVPAEVLLDIKKGAQDC